LFGYLPNQKSALHPSAKGNASAKPAMITIAAGLLLRGESHVINLDSDHMT